MGPRAVCSTRGRLTPWNPAGNGRLGFHIYAAFRSVEPLNRLFAQRSNWWAHERRWRYDDAM